MLGQLKDKFTLDPVNWRDDLLTIVLRVMLMLGGIVYLPSVYLSIVSGLFGLALIDTLALFTVAALFQFDRLPFRWRSAIFGLTLYLVGSSLLISVGAISQIYFFGFSLVTTLLLGRTVGLFASFLSSLTLLVVGAVGLSAPEMVPVSSHASLAGLIVVTINFSSVNVALTLVIAAVVTALEKTLSREVVAYAALQQERTVLRTLVDALPDAVLTKNENGRFMSCNSAALKLVGASHETELIGKTVFDLYARELAESHHQEDLRVLSGSLLLNREEYRNLGQAEPAWYWTIKVPLRDAANEIVGLIDVSRDITDRKRAEAQRDRLLAQLQLQIERMPLAYTLMDTKFRYTYWNPAAEAMFGFAKSDVLGKHPFELIIPAALQPAFASLFEKIEGGDMDAHGEFENCDRDSGTITCEWHNTPVFDTNGQFAGVMSLAQDITDRKKLQEQLQQSRKLEAIGRLAGGIAHDFNNLLTIILGHSEMLLAKAEAASSVSEPIKAIRDASSRAAHLTRQLLAFGRQSILEPKVIDLNTFLIEHDRMLRRLLGQEVLLTRVLDPQLSRMRVDPEQLEQVLVNLVGNARDAMPGGGKLTIETSNVELSEDYVATHLECKAGHHVLLALSDTGVGMTPEVQSRIFEPFFTTKSVGQGTGLGLAMVFGIVKQSGGSINVYSELNHGSTFKVYFPAEDQALGRRSSLSSTSSTKGTETILLVEDEAAVRNLLVLGLELMGYKVIAATDGEDALRVLQSFEGSIEILLTDIAMPNMRGPQLAEQLRPRFADMQVLFMSGYTGDAVVRNGLLRVEAAFIEKPCTPLKLAHRLREMLDSKRNRSDLDQVSDSLDG